MNEIILGLPLFLQIVIFIGIMTLINLIVLIEISRSIKKNIKLTIVAEKDDLISFVVNGSKAKIKIFKKIMSCNDGTTI